jgi:hypothetical protein
MFSTIGHFEVKKFWREIYKSFEGKLYNFPMNGLGSSLMDLVNG